MGKRQKKRKVRQGKGKKENIRRCEPYDLDKSDKGTLKGTFLGEKKNLKR